MAVTIDGSTGWTYADNIKHKYGTGEDLQIYHDGTNSYILDNGAGHLNIKTNGTDISFTKSPHEQLAKFITDGACELYYDNSKKLATAASGVELSNNGTLYHNSLNFEAANGGGDYSTRFGVTNYPDASGYDGEDDGYWARIESKGGTVVIINSDGAYNSARTNHDHFSIYQKANTEVSNAGRRLFSVDGEGAVQFGNAGIRIDNSWQGQPSITVQRDNNAGVDNTNDSAYMRVHGSSQTHAPWTGGATGADFSANFLIDGDSYHTSDRRGKTDIVDCPYGLDIVNKLQPRKYQLVNSALVPQGPDNINLGFIAQEIKEHIPECVNYLGDAENIPNEHGYARAYALSMNEVVPVLTKAIQELSTQVETLKTKVAALEAG